MDQELVERIAESSNHIGGKLSELPNYLAKPLRRDAVAAIRAVGEYLLMELAGFDNACEMRTKIAKECGINE